MKQSFNFSFINLGCTKNLVDSQYFLGRIFDINLKSHNYHVNYFTDPLDKDVRFVFVNTCGFISSARKETEATVHKLLKAGKIVYLMGCAVQYYKGLKGVKGQKGKKEEDLSCLSHPGNLFCLSWGDMNTVSIKDLMQGYDSKHFGDFNFATSPRVYTNIDQKYEYLKIAEGCDNKCTFCIIPQIRGRQQSLSIEKILHEAKQMITHGIKEIILIAQDTSRYGTDLYGKPKLLDLLKKLDALPGDVKYRLLYLYPDVLTLKWIHEMKKLKKFIPYFDIPLQHISSPVLKRMGRFFPQPQKAQVKRSDFGGLRNAADLRNDNFKGNAEIRDFENDAAYDEIYIKKFISQIKDTFPVCFLRTNLIIGFPGETKQDFMKLMTFVKEVRFDNISLFEYHDEPLSAAINLPNKVPAHEIRSRFMKIKKLVESQMSIKSKTRKGKQEIGYVTDIETLKNGKMEKLIIRPRLHAPEIDDIDKIPLKNIIATFNGKNTLEIGDKIVYTI